MFVRDLREWCIYDVDSKQEDQQWLEMRAEHYVQLSYSWSVVVCCCDFIVIEFHLWRQLHAILGSTVARFS